MNNILVVKTALSYTYLDHVKKIEHNDYVCKLHIGNSVDILNSRLVVQQNRVYIKGISPTVLICVRTAISSIVKRSINKIRKTQDK